MYDELQHFFAAYLHQDYNVVSGSIEGAAAEFRDEAPPKMLAIVRAQIDAVLALPDEAIVQVCEPADGILPERSRETLERVRAVFVDTSTRAR